jgi:hypothetical protein
MQTFEFFRMFSEEEHGIVGELLNPDKAQPL